METRSKRRKQEQATVSTIQELDRVIGDCDNDGVQNALALLDSHPEIKERWLESLSKRFGFEYHYDVEEVEPLVLDWARTSKVFTDVVNTNIALNAFKNPSVSQWGPFGVLGCYSSFDHSMQTHLIQNMKIVIEELMCINPTLLSTLCSDSFHTLFGCSLWEAYVIHTGVFIGMFVPKPKKAIVKVMSACIHQATFCPAPGLKTVMEDIVQKMVKNSQVKYDTIGMMLTIIASSDVTMGLQQCVKRTLKDLEENAKLAICNSFINNMMDVGLSLDDEYTLSIDHVSDFYIDWGVHCGGLQIEMVQAILSSLEYSSKSSFVSFLNAFFNANTVLEDEQVPPCMPNLPLLLQMYDQKWNINRWCDLIDVWRVIFPDKPLSSNSFFGVEFECVEMDDSRNVFVDNDWDDWIVSHYVLESGNAHFIGMPRVMGEAHSALLHNFVPACVQHKNAHMLVLPSLKEARRIKFFENHIMRWPKWTEEVVRYFHQRGLIFGDREFKLLMDKIPDVAMGIKSLFS